MNKLYIIRGLPGSGKSTLAKQLAGQCFAEADMYFVDEDGEYYFDPTKLRMAHEWCQNEVRYLLKVNAPVVAVSNTFTQKWEYEPYVKMAKAFGYEVFIIVCQNDFGNIHNVPEEAIARMRARWEN